LPKKKNWSLICGIVILPLIAIFGTGAAASVVLARVAGRPWMWAAAFLNLLIAFHEATFAFLPAAEWIRIDLLLTMPVFTVGNLLLAALAARAVGGWWSGILAASAAAVPVWFFLLR